MQARENNVNRLIVLIEMHSKLIKVIEVTNCLVQMGGKAGQPFSNAPLR